VKKRDGKINKYSPEISLFFSQLLVLLSCYLVIIKKSENWLITTLTVSATLGFINITVLHYSLRPVKSHNRKLAQHGPGYAWAMGILLLVLTASTIMFPAILLENPLGAAYLILSFGAGWSFFLLIALLMVKKSEGPAYKLYGNLKVWHLGALLYLVIGASSWFLADWNPSVPHHIIRAEVVKVKGISGISPGDSCTADISWYRKEEKKIKCRSYFSCNGKRLFGSIGMGIFPCRISYANDIFSVRGADNSTSDGDPAFSINTDSSVILYSTKKPLPYHPELVAKIAKKKH
jgi:hypothetical protein